MSTFFNNIKNNINKFTIKGIIDTIGDGINELRPYLETRRQMQSQLQKRGQKKLLEPYYKIKDKTTKDTQNQQKPVQYVTVKSGDSLSKIAKENNKTLNELIKLNPQLQNRNINILQIGEKIKVSPRYEKQYVDLLKEQKQQTNLSNIEAIHGAKHDQNYVIVDKAKRQLQVFDRYGNLLYTGNGITSGLSGNDYNTITYKSKNGSIQNYAGNNSTPAGITYITGIGTYHNSPSYQRGRKGKDGKVEDVASSIHIGNTSKAYASNGCIRANDKVLKDLQRYIKIGTPVYTLPSNSKSRFKLSGTKLSFVADNPYGKNTGKKAYWDDYNVDIDRSFSPLTIKYKLGNGTRNENVRSFAQALVDKKMKIQKDLNLSSEEYNRLAQLAMGIAEQETKFGTSKSYDYKNASRYFFTSLPSDLAKIYTLGVVSPSKSTLESIYENGVMPAGRALNHILHGRMPHDINQAPSLGFTQIKYKDDVKNAPGLARLYWAYNVDEHTITDPYMSAIATVLRLGHMYNNEIKGREFIGKDGTPVDKYDALLYKYNGKHNQLTRHTATPDKNKYIRNVNNYINNFGFYEPREIEK